MTAMAEAAKTQDAAKTPSAGWIVHGYLYKMVAKDMDTPLGANIFLAHDPGKNQRSICFWMGDNPPTEYHGDWDANTNGLQTLFLKFNGRGLGEDKEKPRPLHGAFLFRTSSNAFEYMGRDYKAREIFMEHYATWVVQEAGVFKQVWKSRPNMVVANDDEGFTLA
jgi:hypothetical protein